MALGVSSSLWDLAGNLIQNTFGRLVQARPSPTGSNWVEFYDGKGNKIVSGSFPAISGSFKGNGSGLTGVTGEWDGTHNGNAQITGSLSLSGSLTGVRYLDFNTNQTDQTVPYLEGRLYYDREKGALTFFNNEADISLQIGQENYLRVYNNNGATIFNGTPVFISGSQGDYSYVHKAQADQHSVGEYKGNHVIGLATHDIEVNSAGYVTTEGMVRGVDTRAFSAGDVLYVSSSLGELTNVRPLPPFEPVRVGYVVRAHQNGMVYVKSHDPVHLDEIVSMSGSALPLDNDLWSYNLTKRVWRNTKTLVGVEVTGSFNGDGTDITGIQTSNLSFNRTEVRQSPYTPLASDFLLGVTHTTGSVVEIRLGLISNYLGKHLVIKDEGMNSSNKNITIIPSGSNLIERTDSYVIARSGASINIYNDGVQNWYVY